MEWLKKKVLVIEDSRVISRLLVHNITSKLHISVETAESLSEAKAILQQQRDAFFVAVVDLNLPDAANGEIVDLVLKAGIPPIVLTGNLSDNLHAEMLDKPIVDYVIKRNLNEIDYVIQLIQRLRDNKNRSVLVVDDSPSSRKLLSSLLKRHNLNVLEAENGKLALDILNKYKGISLVITDFHMPEMDGMELTVTIRKNFSRTDIAIIGISAGDTHMTNTRFLKSGANDFIARPFEHEEFYCRVNQNIDAIANYEKLKRAIEFDFLTGLHNRAFFFKTGSKFFQNAQRNHFNLCVAMFDIDHFKKINDTYGHHIGDEALKHISLLFKEEMRESDIISRIGGEEFALICLNIDAENAKVLFERFLQAVKQKPLVLGDLIVPMTISIGYTLTLKESLEEMLNCADMMLYEAKHSGRDKAVLY